MPIDAVRKIRLHPKTWTIAAKLAVVLVIAALLPMAVVSYYNLRGSLALTSEDEYQQLEQLASSTGGRIDQLVLDTRHILDYLSWSEATIDMVQAPTAAHRAQVEDKMGRLLTANEDIELLMILDAKGKVLAATKSNYLGRDLGFRDYFKEAIRGKQYITDLEVGTASNVAGIYFASPAHGRTGRVAGVVVMKMKGTAVTSIVDQLRVRNPSLSAFLVDDDGIIIYHPDQRMQYHSLTPLPPELLKTMLDEKQFGVNVTDIPSLNLHGLAQKMGNSKQPDHVRFISPISGKPEIVGFAPLGQKGWKVAVSETEENYAAPLTKLFNKAVLSVSLTSVVCLIFALFFARTFTRPLNDLTRAAEAVEKGDLEHATVPVTTDDELGRFASTFNAMIGGVKARQRERDIFGRMVSPEVREKLLTGEIKLGGENLKVSVLFSDIRGFSTMSEKMSPNDVVLLLNEYLTEMTNAVRPWGGYVNNFIGDAIVVIFGAPEARADCERSAICAALAMKERLEVLNQRRGDIGDPLLKTGIGISTGKVVAGQIGSLERFMYTVIGDAVNIAARLEELTKQFEGNPILVNALTYEGSQKKGATINFEDKGLQQVKGRVEPVHVYAVFSEQNQTMAPVEQIS